jgi:hypothetical protein
MRKALLVIALIAASFAGGAFVNGPGLAWVRMNLGLSMLNVEPRDEKQDPNELGALAPKLDAVKEPNIPLERLARSSASALSKRESADRSAPPPLEAPSLAITTLNDVGKIKGDGAQKQESDLAWPDVPGSPPARAFLPAADSATKANPESQSKSRKDAAVLRADVPQEPATSKAQPRLDSAAAVEVARPTSWSELSERMRKLGIQRYWVEGEPGVSVRFRCVVPLIGQSAVGQMFEAEGIDPVAAAELVMRRVALWKASERP